MKLLKAREVLDNAASEMGRPEDPDLWDAMCLGGEAIKRLQDLRSKGYQETQIPLPGETPE